MGTRVASLEIAAATLDRWVHHGGWRRLTRFETGHDPAFDTPREQLLDVGQQRLLFR